MVERHRSHPEIRLLEKHVASKLTGFEPFAFSAGLQAEAREASAVELAHDEHRTPVADAIPVDTGDHPLDVIRETGGAVQRARPRRADRRAQQPEEPTDVIDVGVGDEDVRDLMDDPRR